MQVLGKVPEGYGAMVPEGFGAGPGDVPEVSGAAT